MICTNNNECEQFTKSVNKGKRDIYGLFKAIYLHKVIPKVTPEVLVTCQHTKQYMYMYSKKKI